MSQPTKITFLAFVLILYCFAFQGSRGLFDPDEGRYSAVALQMLKSGDWLVPRYRGEPFYDKPALTYWAIAASYGADITLRTLRGTEAAPPTIAVLERAVEEALSGFGFRVRVSARRTDK